MNFNDHMGNSDLYVSPNNKTKNWLMFLLPKHSIFLFFPLFIFFSGCVAQKADWIINEEVDVNKLKKEVENFKRLAENGNQAAQYDIGYLYYTGKGVIQDYRQALKWFSKAAEQDDPTAQYYLGLMHANGQGVIVDYVEAHRWANIARSKQVTRASYLIEELERRMTFSQIAEAQRLAKEWINQGNSGSKIKTAKTLPSRIPRPPKSVGTGIATGTGFLFGSQDYIITNYHVVKGASKVKVKFLNGEIIDAQIAAKDTRNDIAILKLNKTPSVQASEIRFGDSSIIRMGDKVFTIGYPAIGIMGLKPKYTEGAISAVTGINDNSTMFQITVPIQPGNSGGPLFNEKGEVVGLTTASLSLTAIDSMGAVPQNVNYAVKASFVKNIIGSVPESLLSNRGIVVTQKKPNSRADFLEKISKNIVLILGNVN
jgi:S1-C subfamily serine protease